MLEIGSEFWLEHLPQKKAKNLPPYLRNYANIIFTTTGAGAISLLLQHIQPKTKSVLLPAYICESVIQPFQEMGYECNYYEVDENLVPDLESIRAGNEVGVFLHLGYYGFPTNSNLTETLQAFKEASTLIIEDLTHSLFSSYEKSAYNDFYIGSFRKWFGVPSGGFLASADRMSVPLLEENYTFPNIRLTALLTKGEYIRTGRAELKKSALRKFSEAECLLDTDIRPYGIDGLSMEIICTLNVEELMEKRKINYGILEKGMATVECLQALPLKGDDQVCPLFFPVRIKKEDRNRIRSLLAVQGIYCPIHWPLPPQLKTASLTTTINIFDQILSIPCDQRYGPLDMKRILSTLRSIQ